VFSVHFDITISGATMLIDDDDVVTFLFSEVSGLSVVLLGKGEGLTVSGFSDVRLGIGEGLDVRADVVTFGKEEVGEGDVVTDAVEVGGAEVDVLVHFP